MVNLIPLTFQTFSFASWYSPIPHENRWGALRVINEDRVSSGSGFLPHAHREYEIFSYVVDGTLKHCDSVGNHERFERGQIQMTSAGLGVVHSGGNGAEGGENLHFLQVWATPQKRGLTPTYYTRFFCEKEKTNKLVLVVAPVGSDPSVIDEREATGPTPVHSNLTMYSTILEPESAVEHTFKQPKGYLHLIMRQTGYRSPRTELGGKGPHVTVTVGSQAPVELEEGDGVYLDNVQGETVSFRASGEGNAEFVLFDLADERDVRTN
ncbi:hypothetical protein OIV83_005198 [Microbotryomycetes sp. JL201]|nr:hypothetical protein OIV83_005198 [Microbotryomycetes sp. JL201]